MAESASSSVSASSRGAFSLPLDKALDCCLLDQPCYLLDICTTMVSDLIFSIGLKISFGLKISSGHKISSGTPYLFFGSAPVIWCSYRQFLCSTCYPVFLYHHFSCSTCSFWFSYPYFACSTCYSLFFVLVLPALRVKHLFFMLIQYFHTRTLRVSLFCTCYLYLSMFMSKPKHVNGVIFFSC